MEENFMDVGFVWTELNAEGQPPTDPNKPCTMAFGFGGDNMDGESSDGGYAKKGSVYRFTFWDLAETPNLTMDSVTIETKKAPGSKHDNSNPFSKVIGTITQFYGNGIGVSSALNATAPAWGTTTYDVTKEGDFLITVKLQVSAGGVTHYYQVDPELVVGNKAKGSVSSQV